MGMEDHGLDLQKGEKTDEQIMLEIRKNEGTVTRTKPKIKGQECKLIPDGK